MQIDMTALFSGRIIYRIKKRMKSDAGWSPVNCGKVEVNKI